MTHRPNRRSDYCKFDRYRFNRYRRWLGSVVVVFSFAIVVHGTLSPYQFDFSSLGMERAQARLVSLLQVPPLDRAFWVDALLNILFFMPFGFGWGCLWTNKGQVYLAKQKSSQALSQSITRQKRRQLIVSMRLLAVSGCLSFGVELLQLFTPSRTTSAFDLLCNTAGGVLGGWLIVYSQQWRRGLSFPLVRAAIALGLLTFLLFSPYRSTSLQSWQESYYLTVGNEVTGGRPWQGEVGEFSLFDRVASELEIEAFLKAETPIADAVASYQFDSSAGRGVEVVRSPKSIPPLVWQGSSTPDSNQANSISISPKRWLITKTAPSRLSAALMRNDAFTLTAKISSAKVKQFGPARIISLSLDNHNRNFTLGQSGSALIFQLATAWTGRNGIWPEFVISGVFDSTDNLGPHNLVVTYQNPLLTAYIDNLSQVHQLNLSPKQTWLWTGLNIFRATKTKYWKAQANSPVLSLLSSALYWTICFFLLVVLVHAFSSLWHSIQRGSA